MQDSETTLFIITGYNFIHLRVPARENREVGLSPTRSRHCNEELIQYATGTIAWEGWTSVDSKPGDLPSNETELDYGNVHDFLLTHKIVDVFYLEK